MISIKLKSINKSRNKDKPEMPSSSSENKIMPIVSSARGMIMKNLNLANPNSKKRNRMSLQKGQHLLKMRLVMLCQYQGLFQMFLLKIFAYVTKYLEFSTK